MRWGTEQEPNARALYEIETGVEVRQVGFTIHEEYAWCGASPDGLVGLDGAIEIKCPNTATHLETVENQKIGSRYYAQMQWLMFVNDLAWCDFVSYDPRIPIAGLQLYVERVERDEKWISTTFREAQLFEYELRDRVESLKKLAEEKR
jgi:predicted phage-related endonuclease